MLKRLVINHLRNIDSRSFDLDPRFNIICGANGSGKTAFLEAIYFLSHGRSFRANRPSRMISHQENAFNLFCELELEDKTHKIGLSREQNGDGQLKIDGKNEPSHVAAARLVPTLLFNPESFSQFWQGAKMRRALIDWGLFYQRGAFFKNWQLFSRNLKQRNAALRSGAKADMVTLWDEPIAQLADKIDADRKAYIEAFFPVVEAILADFLPHLSISMSYVRGWSKEKTLMDCLQDNLEQDQKLGYTYAGPHRSDIRFRVGSAAAIDVLSRGQQKLLICALKLAQGMIFEELSGQSGIYLLDDLCSELDAPNRQKLFDRLAQMRSQVFVTIIEPELLDLKDKKLIEMGLNCHESLTS